MARVLITPHMWLHQPSACREIIERAGHEVVFPPPGLNTLERDNILRVLRETGAAGMLAGTDPLDREVLSLSQLRVVARQGVGFDSIDIAAATDLGIAVTITPGTLEASVAEQTLALMLAVSRGVIDRDQQVRHGDWSRVALPRLAGRVFGIVGTGRIGRAVIRRILAMEMSVVAFDPKLTEADAESLGIRRVETLAELIAAADVISLHCPCTPATRNMFDEAAIRAMKPRAILLNMGRGGLVDEAALARVLAEGHLLGAGLDVFETEPLPLDSPLLDAPRLVLASHMGGIDEESGIAAGNLAAQCIVDVLAGQRPEACLVNPEVQLRAV